MKFTIILQKAEEGGYTVRCLELPGAISQGETKKEALANIREAIGLMLEVLQEDMIKQSQRPRVEVVKLNV